MQAVGIFYVFIIQNVTKYVRRVDGRLSLSSRIDSSAAGVSAERGAIRRWEVYPSEGVCFIDHTRLAYQRRLTRYELVTGSRGESVLWRDASRGSTACTTGVVHSQLLSVP